MIGSWDYEHILECFVIIIPEILFQQFFSTHCGVFRICEKYICFIYTLITICLMFCLLQRVLMCEKCAIFKKHELCFSFSHKLGVRKEKLTQATFKWLKMISRNYINLINVLNFQTYIITEESNIIVVKELIF